MEKKEVFGYSFFALIVLVLLFFIANRGGTGYVVYDAGNAQTTLCQPDSPFSFIETDNSLVVSINCHADLGPSISIASSTLACYNNTLQGTNSGNIGLAVSAANVNLYSCNIRGFTDNITVSNGADVTINWFLRVNVTNSSGAAISGANVELTETTKSYSGVSDATGYYDVNASGAKMMNPGGTTNYGPYMINVTKTGYAENHTVNYVADADKTMNVILFVPPDTTAPTVAIQSPSGAYTSTGVDVNMSLNEAGACNYSTDAGATNYTATANTTNTGFNSTFTGTDGSSYTLHAYCWDTAGNYNGTVTSAFNIAVPAVPVVTPPSNNGGGCTASSWVCYDWLECANGTERRECTSNCGTKKWETQRCGVVCADQCSVIGRSCSGNSIATCSVNEQGCYVLSKEDCGSDLMCSSGKCIAFNNSQTVIPVVNEKSSQSSDSGTSGTVFSGGLSKLRPSNFIPHGDLPAAVVDTAAGTVAVGAVAGAGWAVWMWLAVLFLPLFAIKLRHYSVSVFDSANGLKMLNAQGKVDEMRLFKLLAGLQQQFGTMVFAEKDSEGLKYIVHSGFIEIRTDGLFIITGHFSKSKDSQAFENALRSVLRGYAGKAPIMKQVERASILGAWRAFMRERRSMHELEKLSFH